MSLAHELHMTRRELLNTVDSYELAMWEQYFKIVNERREKKREQPKEKVESDIKNFFMAKTKGKKHA